MVGSHIPVIMITEMKQREIMSLIVEAYTETGSRSAPALPASGTTVVASDGAQRDGGSGRNGSSIFAAYLGGRLPTEAGLRMFVDGLLEVGNLTEEERKHIESMRRRSKPQQVLEEATNMLSGLSSCAGQHGADPRGQPATY